MAKGAVCKTAMRRFEPARRLHFLPPIHRGLPPVPDSAVIASTSWSRLDFDFEVGTAGGLPCGLPHADEPGRGARSASSWLIVECPINCTQSAWFLGRNTQHDLEKKERERERKRGGEGVKVGRAQVDSHGIHSLIMIVAFAGAVINEASTEYLYQH